MSAYMCMSAQVYGDTSEDRGYGVRTAPLAERPSWRWDCRMAADNHITVELQEAPAASCAGASSRAAPAAAALSE